MSHELVKAGASGTLTIRTMDDLARLGNMLAQSGYFTDAREAAQAGVKVLAGLEMGIGAFAAMSGIHIIEGKPSVGAGLMAAAVKRHPKYDYRVKRHDAEACVVTFYEDGEVVGESSFTIEDAKQAGVAFKSRQGYPTPWAKNPRNMLFARALSNGVRWYCPDVFDVSTYTPEELGAATDDEGNIIDVQHAPAPAPRASVGDLGAPDAEPEPEQEPVEAESEGMFPPDPPEGTLDEPEPEPVKGDVTASQLKALAVGMKKQGLEDRNVARAFMSWLFNREISSSKELSKGEASRIIGWTENQWQQALLDYADSMNEPEGEEAA